MYDSASSGHYYNGYTDGYQEGIEDAWQTARKLFSDMTERNIRAIFPCEWAAGGFHTLIKLKPYEAIEKVKEFEVKQKMQRRNKMKKIKQCPFCGKPGETFQIPENTPEENANHPYWKWRDAGLWVVGCWTEGCFGNINHKAMVFMNEEQAIDAWNTRRRPV